MRRHRVRAYPTPKQQAALARLFGCVRVAYNDALRWRETAHAEGATLTRAEISRRLTATKSTPQRAWLAEVSSVPLQQALADADQAYRNFFASLTGRRRGPRMGRPRFKRKSNRQSARFTKNARFTVTETSHGVGHATLPKIGRVRYTASRPLPSDPSSVTVIREPDGRYYLSFVIEVHPIPLPATDRVAGVDVGLTDLAVIAGSDGTREKIGNPRWERTRHVKLARAQRALSRTQKGSQNRDKARTRVASQHRKTRDARLDHHHKLALRLVRENQTVAVEGLSVAGLARTRMARSIHDAGWATLTRLLHEKASRYGRTIVVTDRWAPTTQTCSVCGTPGGKKPLSVREWDCLACGTRLDRDFNAAVNIMVAAGLAETLNACGGSIRLRLAGADPMKQEPAEHTHAA